MKFKDYSYDSQFKRKILNNTDIIVCPNCLKEIKEPKYPLLSFLKINCSNCFEDIGFIKGYVKARKLGSYFRLTNNQMEKSLDISSLGSDFDIRSKDYIIVLYLLNLKKARPIAILNKTINELYYLEFEKKTYEVTKPKDWDDEYDGNFKEEYYIDEHAREISKEIIQIKDLPDIKDFFDIPEVFLDLNFKDI